jgi:hypothetical protein
VHIQLRFGRHIDTSSEIFDDLLQKGGFGGCACICMLDSTFGEDAHEGVRKTQTSSLAEPEIWVVLITGHFTNRTDTKIPLTQSRRSSLWHMANPMAQRSLRS